MFDPNNYSFNSFDQFSSELDDTLSHQGAPSQPNSIQYMEPTLQSYWDPNFSNPYHNQGPNQDHLVAHSQNFSYNQWAHSSSNPSFPKEPNYHECQPYPSDPSASTNEPYHEKRYNNILRGLEELQKTTNDLCQTLSSNDHSIKKLEAQVVDMAQILGIQFLDGTLIEPSTNLSSEPSNSIGLPIPPPHMDTQTSINDEDIRRLEELADCRIDDLPPLTLDEEAYLNSQLTSFDVNFPSHAPLIPNNQGEIHVSYGSNSNDLSFEHNNPTLYVEEGLSMGEPYISMETISFSTLSYMSPTYPPRLDKFYDHSTLTQPSLIKPTFESQPDFGLNTLFETQCDETLDSSLSGIQDQEPMEPLHEPISYLFESECPISTPWVEPNCDHIPTPEVESTSLEQTLGDETNHATNSLTPEQELVIDPLLASTSLPHYDMIIPSHLDCHNPWSDSHHKSSFTIGSSLDHSHESHQSSTSHPSPNWSNNHSHLGQSSCTLCIFPHPFDFSFPFDPGGSNGDTSG